MIFGSVPFSSTPIAAAMSAGYASLGRSGWYRLMLSEMQAKSLKEYHKSLEPKKQTKEVIKSKSIKKSKVIEDTELEIPPKSSPVLVWAGVPMTPQPTIQELIEQIPWALQTARFNVQEKFVVDVEIEKRRALKRRQQEDEALVLLLAA